MGRPIKTVSDECFLSLDMCMLNGLAAGSRPSFYSSGIWKSPPEVELTRIHLGLAFSYGLAAILVENQIYSGRELALGSSVVFTTYCASKVVKTRGRDPVQLLLCAVGGVATFFHHRFRGRKREVPEHQI
ncbi:hypothetical protein BGZ63DRAFT_396177 [Mariannaea sp. PMI_226]|nr:hypothetical protein BGZ63DRAFT_396177 [Mariannaea sp. PMI_226]